MSPDAPAAGPAPARTTGPGRSGRRSAIVSRRRTWGPLTLGVGAVLLAAAVSIAVGSRTLSPADVLAGLQAVLGDGDHPAAAVVAARIDRTIIGAVVGMAVALSGAAMQGLTRNPLADPGIIGVNAGAALAVVLGIQLLGIGSAGTFVWLALLGGIAAAVIVYAVAAAAPGGAAPLTMALAGAALTAGAVSVTAGVLVSDRGALDTFRFWQVGSVAGRSASLVLDVAPLLVVSLVIVAFAGPILNATALGDDLERALGQRVHLARGVVALGAVGLAASAVALAGPVGFVGLVVPHLVRLVTGPDYRRILLGSALVGPVLVMLTDTLGRVVMPPSEVQVGIMTAVLGAPGLIWLVRRTAVR
ncbi:iron chelate uptake ABC transporter family permease subunit [Ornithinimicrobium humiphilum]|uniref:Iron complex transport system permease protein n=1 Tax=Ornithinimicrobium humiphilum TaxID=125288 RepID=A0A543K852_9MICO|nr:iron ABC transporter permease [Ornithinimicrobium humiphilum]TQM91240.1 iron complex transport system permease protein [Ornithinimicrobium humiphilum]